MAGLATVVSDGVSVTDVGWLRLNLWRELLAGLFDHPLLTPELDHIRSVRVDVARPTNTLRISKAAFYLGWLASRLGWEVDEPLVHDKEDDVLRGAFRRGRRDIPVELRPVRATLDGSQRAAGLARPRRHRGGAGQVDRPRPDHAPGRPPAGHGRLERRPGHPPRRPPRAVRGDAVHCRGARAIGQRPHLRAGAHPRREAGQQWLTSEDAGGTRATTPSSIVLEDAAAVAREAAPAGAREAQRSDRGARRRPHRADRRLVGRAALQRAHHARVACRARLGPRPPVVGRRALRAHRPSRVERRDGLSAAAGDAHSRGTDGQRRRLRRRRLPATSRVCSINPENVHPVEVEETLGDSDPVELAAQRYSRDLARWVPTARHGVPRFDVMLTGIGPDGHIMSIFPGSPALAPDAPMAIGVPAPTHVEPHLPRVTLTRAAAAHGRASCW